MQRKKTQRRFTERNSRNRSPFAATIALVLLMLIGIGSFMSSQTASARNTPTPSPAPGETAAPFVSGLPETAASQEPAEKTEEKSV